MIDPADRVVRAIARMWRPVWAWEQGARDPAPTIAALESRPPVTLKGKRAPVEPWAPRVALSVAD